MRGVRKRLSERQSLGAGLGALNVSRNQRSSIVHKDAVKTIVVTAFLLLAVLVSAARAEYPDHGIKIFVAWPPGGSTDIVARFVAEQLSTALKQPVVVENRPGANGNIGAEMFARLPADGYSLMIATAETHAINPHVYTKLGYDVTRDFEPIALLAQVDFVLIARTGLAANNVQEFINLAKASPGGIKVGSYGLGSTSHLALAALEEKTGASFLHIPYRGLTPAVNAIMTGEIDAAFVSPNSVLGIEKSGQAKILGAASLQRPAVAPNVPTFAEQGIADFVNGNWYGIVAPHGLPTEIKERLENEMRNIAGSELFAQRLGPAAIEVRYLDAAQFSEFLRSENERWGKIVEARKIKVEQ
jgi:tripartite-type tricarboxylate transporter receptor subunit TctC